MIVLHRFRCSIEEWLSRPRAVKRVLRRAPSPFELAYEVAFVPMAPSSEAPWNSAGDEEDDDWQDGDCAAWPLFEITRQAG